jgi:hypothetical protein
VACEVQEEERLKVKSKLNPNKFVNTGIRVEHGVGPNGEPVTRVTSKQYRDHLKKILKSNPNILSDFLRKNPSS